MRTENLEKLGLSPNESKIYLALLEIGASTADKISQKAGIHRRTIYDNIEKLLNKGLISYAIKENKKYFEAADPHKLEEIINEKKEIVRGQEKVLSQILPNLIAAQNRSKDKQEVNIYKGKKGIKTILWDILRTGEQNCVIGAHAIDEFKDLLALFHKERIKHKIKNRMIFKKEDIQRAKRFSKMAYTDVRLLPTEYDSPIAINVYADKVALLIRSPSDPLGILIKNKENAEGFKAHFEVLWKSCGRHKHIY